MAFVLVSSTWNITCSGGSRVGKTSRCRHSPLQSSFICCIGMFVGFLISTLLLKNVNNVSCGTKPCCRNTWLSIGRKSMSWTRPSQVQMFPHLQSESKFEPKEKLVYIGVMTAQKYLSTRGIGVYQSWARLIPGKVEFFTSADEYHDVLPIVNLPEVDDSVYPPQKKSFMMLKYMHDNYINQYEWFVRSDDDVFIHGDRLASFLRSLNSSRTLYLGQAGQGIHQEFGRLGLDAADNYCMGGTTMIFSRATLRKIVPHITYCIKHLVSMHEDVEIGRCVRKFAGTSCPWAFEFRNLFYQNHGEPNGSFTRADMLKLEKPITMHPVKDSRHLHRLQVYFLGRKIDRMRYDNLQRFRDITAAGSHLEWPQGTSSASPTSPLCTKYHAEFEGDVIPWTYFDKVYYPTNEVSQRRNIPRALIHGVNAIVSGTMRLINVYGRELGRHIDFRSLLYGYHRIDPIRGAEYVTDLLLTYHKHRGRNVKVPVRRHTYLRQPFTEAEVHVESKMRSSRPSTVIHFIVPVFQRASTFVRFMKNYESICLQKEESAHLVIVAFGQRNSSDYLNLLNYVRLLGSKYPEASIDLVRGSGAFSRAAALQQGSLTCPTDSLLFFVDLDIEFNSDAISRLRLNTKKGMQAYFPVVFSQYDPSIVCDRSTSQCLSDVFILSDARGYWRHFGFGITSIYREDFLRIGGFDLTIKGWGKEDVDLFERCIKHDVRVFRSADAGLVHIYHDVKCPSWLSISQYRMCFGSMSSTYAPLSLMSEFVYTHDEIYNKDVYVPSNVTARTTQRVS